MDIENYYKGVKIEFGLIWLTDVRLRGKSRSLTEV